MIADFLKASEMLSCTNRGKWDFSDFVHVSQNVDKYLSLTHLLPTDTSDRFINDGNSTTFTAG